MIQIGVEGEQLRLTAEEGDLAPRHASQLAFWGFRRDAGTKEYLSPSGLSGSLTRKVVQYLKRCDCMVVLSEEAQSLLDEHERIEGELRSAFAAGQEVKAGHVEPADAAGFLSFLNSIPRELKAHQRKAAVHMLAVRNGANFSVPGSGKTAVVLSVFQWLRETEEVDSLFVVGPPACFGPWQTEYELTLGESPSCVLLAGGDIDDRRSNYEVNADTVADLYLTTFQTLLRDWEHVRILFEHQGVRFLFVVDEAHYVKQPGGAWAGATLAVSRHAARRCILTGTPFPRSYGDAFNLFEVLWPESPPISDRERVLIELHTQRQDYQEAANVLDAAIAPLFYRTRKQDLGLSPQHFHTPIVIRMNPVERAVYDSIINRVRALSRDEYVRDVELIMRLQRGRITRLRQCLSYVAMLSTAIDEYREDLLEDSESLAHAILHYDELESPAKLEALLGLVRDLLEHGEKIVVWSTFVGTLKRIRDAVQQLGVGVRLVYGGTPLLNASIDEELSREGIIREFASPDSSVDVLVANPAACGESVSLHKTCSHAIYYDLSYNCAQYLQSLDRIHRVGGSETKEAHYDFLQYEDSLDQDIFSNVQQKAQRMSAIIDQEYPIYSLDMFAAEEELEAYARIFGQD